MGGADLQILVGIKYLFFKNDKHTRKIFNMVLFI
jgi:hypothetical protein